MPAAENFNAFWGFLTRTAFTTDGQVYVCATVIAFCLGYLVRALISQRRRARVRYLKSSRIKNYAAWTDPSDGMAELHESGPSTKSS